MKKSVLAVAVLALMLSAGGAFAAGPPNGDHNNDGHGDCGQGGCQGGNGGNGGNGGAGGHGGAAFAFGNIQGQQQQQQQGQIGINKNYNDLDNSSRNTAYGGVAVSGGNTNKQSVIIEDSGRADVNYSGAYTVKSAPAIAIGGPASGPCNGFSGGIAGSGIGFGFAANASTLDEGCEDRETARMLHLLGDTAAGLELLKTSKAYTRMQERKAEAKKKAEADTVKSAEDQSEVTRRAAIRQKNPTSDGSWTSGSAEQLPTRIWTGNSQGESTAFIVR